jgi:acetyl-CoA carboxylase, biotin carboxylase subunit
MFEKILVANRGEIAVRVIRALRELGVRSVAVYSDADRESLAVRMADEAVHLGASPSSDSYLRPEKIIAAATRLNVEAIHPGYGFLSENADFADACAAAGIKFIGPPADAIRRLGSKTSARRIAIAAGAPVVPGTEDAVTDLNEARRIAHEIGFPVLIKAAAGGGGKGMRRVNSGAALEAALRDAASEAERSFKSSEVYIEKVVVEPRHIEIQLIGDEQGNLVHLGERECSIQRRHQKVIEECPSPLVAAHPEMRRAMGDAALKIARAAGYCNAGTAEFLVDVNRNFYFLEMNTRLQVEHPVTELVTGLDLVHLQLRIASGEKLPFGQEDVTWRGAAIEARIYAEDPANDYLPSPGRIAQLQFPSGPGIRLDSGIHEGCVVPIEYDPLLAKLSVWASTRETAIARMQRALDECAVIGIRTNIEFFRQLVREERFRNGNFHTGYLETFQWKATQPTDEEMLAAVMAAAQYKAAEPRRESGPSGQSRWKCDGRDRWMR